MACQGGGKQVPFFLRGSFTMRGIRKKKRGVWGANRRRGGRRAPIWSELNHGEEAMAYGVHSLSKYYQHREKKDIHDQQFANGECKEKKRGPMRPTSSR